MFPSQVLEDRRAFKRHSGPGSVRVVGTIGIKWRKPSGPHSKDCGPKDWNVTSATEKRDKRRGGGKTECNEFVSDNNFQTPSPNSHEYSNSFLSLKQVRFVVGALQSKPGLFSFNTSLLL